MDGPLNSATACGTIAQIRGHARLGQAEPVQLGFFIVQTDSGQLRNKLLHNCQAPADTSSATRTAVRFESKTCSWTCAETGFRTL
jgi:hypothetical protein